MADGSVSVSVQMRQPIITCDQKPSEVTAVTGFHTSIFRKMILIGTINYNNYASS